MENIFNHTKKFLKKYKSNIIKLLDVNDFWIDIILDRLLTNYLYDIEIIFYEISREYIDTQFKGHINKKEKFIDIRKKLNNLIIESKYYDELNFIINSNTSEYQNIQGGYNLLL